MSPCAFCETPVTDADVCGGCGRRLELAIGDVPSLVADLDITLTRQSAGEQRVGSRGTDHPMPFDARASTVAANLRATLCSWVLLVHDERYGGECRCAVPLRRCGFRPLPEDRVSAMAGWLLGGSPSEVEWLRHHVAAVEAHRELLDVITNARRVVDRPMDRVFVGVCSFRLNGVECTEPLYAKRFSVDVRCRICGTTHAVAERRAVLKLAVDDVLARPAEIARAVVWLGQHVRQDQITRWVQGKVLPAKGHMMVGEAAKPLYRIGDVLDLLAKQEGTRASA